MNTVEKKKITPSWVQPTSFAWKYMFSGCASLALLGASAAMAQNPLAIDKDGSVAIGTRLSFPPATGEKITLFDANYSIGMQNNTTYFRTAANFGWYMGGTPNGNSLDAGGGKPLMILQSGTNGLTIGNYAGNNPIRFSSNWTGFADSPETNRAEISNDTSVYKSLLVVGNKSAGGLRQVSIYDQLNVDKIISKSPRNLSVGSATDTMEINNASETKVVDVGFNPIRFSSKYTAFPDGFTNRAEISNDTENYKSLMILGNRSSSDEKRYVSIYDRLYVDDQLLVQGRIWTKENKSWRYLGGSGLYYDNPPEMHPSDLRLKSDVRPISSALESVRRLNGVTYKWDGDALKYFTRDIETNFSAGPNSSAEENQAVWQTERGKQYRELSTTQVGVIAQDVEAVLPEAVTTDSAGYKAVNYTQLIPLLIEAVKELDKTVKSQQGEIERLKVGPTASK